MQAGADVFASDSGSAAATLWAAIGQTVPILRIRDENGIEVAGFNNTGKIFAPAALLGQGSFSGYNNLVIGEPNNSYPNATVVVSPALDSVVCLVLERKTSGQYVPLLRVVDETGATLGEINQTGGWSAPTSTMYCAALQCGTFGSPGNIDFSTTGTDRLHVEYTGDIVVRNNTRFIRNPKTLTPGATVALSSLQGNVFELVPDQDSTININSSYPDVLYNGQEFDLVITTSGTTAWIVTFGTGFVADGTLSTGTVDGKKFVVSFVVSGGVAVEKSRKGPM